IVSLEVADAQRVVDDARRSSRDRSAIATHVPPHERVPLDARELERTAFALDVDPRLGGGRIGPRGQLDDDLVARRRIARRERTCMRDAAPARADEGGPLV